MVETPLALLRSEQGENFNALRTNYPKMSQLMVAGILREELPKFDLDPELKIIDMKAPVPKDIEIYGEVGYGFGKLQKARVGLTFDAVRDDLVDSDIIGLTANFTQEAGVIRDFIKFAKSISQAKVIVGGSDAIARPESYLQSGADVVVKGEGEIIGPKAVSALMKHEDLRGLSGIAFTDSHGMVSNPVQSKDTIDVNQLLFPAFDLVDLEQYNEDHEGQLLRGVKAPLMYLETSRGCKQVCTFCTTPYLRRGYRYMSQERVKKWLEYYKTFGLRTLILIEDSMFSRLHYDGGRSELLQMFQTMREMGFAWEFGTGFELGKLMDRQGDLDHELIETLFSNNRGNPFVGCYRAYVPLESLRDDAPFKFKKLKPWNAEKEIIRALIDAGMPALGFGVIIGFPDETEETISLTLHRCEELREVCYKAKSDVILYFQIFNDTLLPGTADFRKDYWRLAYDIDAHPELFNFYTSILNGDYLEYHKFSEMRKEMVRILNGGDAIKFWQESGKYY